MINIGDQPASDFTNPLGVLSDCHRRVERFLRLLITVTAQANGGALNGEQREALETALGYFREAAPKHTADEEDSLFPRLRASHHPQVAAALAIIDALERDHAAAQADHARVDTLGRRWLTDGYLSQQDTQDLAVSLRQLDAIYQRHIAVEDRELFPLAGRVLDTSDLTALGREMARRRGLDPDTLA